MEILQALYRGVDILDEPNGGADPAGAADDLLRILSELCEQGKTVILITHKFREIMAITDHVSVMRQGKMVAHRTQIEAFVKRLGSRGQTRVAEAA